MYINQSKNRKQIEIGTVVKVDGNWKFFNAGGSFIIDNGYVIGNINKGVWKAETDINYATLLRHYA